MCPLEGRMHKGQEKEGRKEEPGVTTQGICWPWSVLTFESRFENNQQVLCFWRIDSSVSTSISLT